MIEMIPNIVKFLAVLQKILHAFSPRMLQCDKLFPDNHNHVASQTVLVTYEV